MNFEAPHKGRSFVQARKQKVLVNPEKIELPPYYPDHPVVRNEVRIISMRCNCWITR